VSDTRPRDWALPVGYVIFVVVVSYFWARWLLSWMPQVAP